MADIDHPRIAGNWDIPLIQRIYDHPRVLKWALKDHRANVKTLFRSRRWWVVGDYGVFCFRPLYMTVWEAHLAFLPKHDARGPAQDMVDIVRDEGVCALVAEDINRPARMLFKSLGARRDGRLYVLRV